jgi:hypothetical protein
MREAQQTPSSPAGGNRAYPAALNKNFLDHGIQFLYIQYVKS